MSFLKVVIENYELIELLVIVKKLMTHFLIDLDPVLFGEWPPSAKSILTFHANPIQLFQIDDRFDVIIQDNQ